MGRSMVPTVDDRGGGQTPIRFGTYNIRNGRNSGLESAFRGMGQANLDVGVFQETKLMDRIYTRVQGSCNIGAEPTPWWRCTFLSVISHLCGRGDTPVWRERNCVPTGNGGAALIHCRMLPGAGRQGKYLGR